MKTNRFSRDNFGGGDEGEVLAHQALTAHESTLTPGTRVRVVGGRQDGMVCTVIGNGPGRTVRAEDEHGLTWTIETRDVEVA